MPDIPSPPEEIADWDQFPSWFSTVYKFAARCVTVVIRVLIVLVLAVLWGIRAYLLPTVTGIVVGSNFSIAQSSDSIILDGMIMVFVFYLDKVRCAPAAPFDRSAHWPNGRVLSHRARPIGPSGHVHESSQQGTAGSFRSLGAAEDVAALELQRARSTRGDRILLDYLFVCLQK